MYVIPRDPFNPQLPGFNTYPDVGFNTKKKSCIGELATPARKDIIERQRPQSWEQRINAGVSLLG